MQRKKQNKETYQEKKNADRIEGYSTFTIKNPNEEKITYEIYLTERFSEKNVINPNYIKLYLTDNSDKAFITSLGILY